MAFTGAVAASGCVPARSTARPPGPPRPVPKPTSRPASGSRIVVPLGESVATDGPSARSVQGQPIRSWIYGTPSTGSGQAGERTVLFLGGIHGSEPAGVPLCEALRDYLAEHPEALAGRRVVVAPAVNPDALAARTRANARGVDVNRNFDASGRKPSRRHGMKALSEVESRFVADLVKRFKPAAIVAIHQAATCVDYDGPALGLARAMSRACGLPVRKLGAHPGSLGSYAGVDLGIPVVTLELPAVASRWDGIALWNKYGEALLVAIRLTGVE